MEGRVRKVSYQKCSTPPHQKHEADARPPDIQITMGTGEEEQVKGRVEQEVMDLDRTACSKPRGPERERQKSDVDRHETDAARRKKSNESASGGEHAEVRIRHRSRSGNEEDLHSQPHQRFGDATSRLNRCFPCSIRHACQVSSARE